MVDTIRIVTGWFDDFFHVLAVEVFGSGVVDANEGGDAAPGWGVGCD